MNRQQKRHPILTSRQSDVLTDLVNIAKIKKALDEYKPIAEGARVKLNYERISSHPDYSRLVPEYQQYVESNKDKEFTVVHDTNPKFSNTVFLKDETGTSIWKFWEGELIIVKEKSNEN